MTNQNENLKPEQNSEKIAINENGELVVNDPQLAEALQELSLEELEEIAGGTINGSGCTTNQSNCGQQEM